MNQCTIDQCLTRLHISDNDVVVFTHPADEPWNAIDDGTGNEAMLRALSTAIHNRGLQNVLFIHLDHGAKLESITSDQLLQLGLRRAA